MRKVIALVGLSVAVLGCATTRPVDRPIGLAGTSTVATATDPPSSSPRPDGPAANGPWIGAAVASDAMLRGRQDSFMAVWVDVPQGQSEAHAPAAVAIVIDTSGSMAGDKIANARKAASKFIDGLSDGDIVSFHTFSDSANERVAPVKLDARTRAQLASSIKEISADGGTNLFEGVRTAGLAVMNAPATHAVRRVVLISDGLATVGNTSKDMLSMLGEKASEHGVQITSIGVGLDYDEKTLNALAIKSSGRLYHLEHSDQLANIMSEEMGLLKATRATNATIEIVPAPGVQLVSAEGSRGMFDGTKLKVSLGAMFAGQHKEFIVRTRVTADDMGTRPVASVRLVFDDPAEGNLQRVQEAVARVEIVEDGKLVEARRNAKADGILAMIDASKTTDTAIAALANEDFRSADEELAKAEKSLNEQATRAKDKGDRDRFEASARRIGETRAGASKAAAAPPSARPQAARAMELKANDAAREMEGF